MTEKQYPILDAGEVGASLEKLHDQIAREYERVVITRQGSDARCVLISQAELSGLERAAGDSIRQRGRCIDASRSAAHRRRSGRAIFRIHRQP